MGIGGWAEALLSASSNLEVAEAKNLRKKYEYIKSQLDDVSNETEESE